MRGGRWQTSMCHIQQVCSAPLQKNTRSCQIDFTASYFWRSNVVPWSLDTAFPPPIPETTGSRTLLLELLVVLIDHWFRQLKATFHLLILKTSTWRQMPNQYHYHHTISCTQINTQTWGHMYWCIVCWRKKVVHPLFSISDLQMSMSTTLSSEDCLLW